MVAEPGLRTSEPVIGYRAWRVRGGRLCALTGESAQEWLPGAIVDARCDEPGRRVPHLAPARGCGCGAYAVDSLATMQRVLGRIVGRRRRDVVVGAVQMWGAPGRPVIVGELRGQPGLQMRAPHMRVVALVESRRALRLGRELGVAVIAPEHLERHATEHGVQLRPAGRRREAAASSWIDWSDLVWLGRALWWCLRHLAPPVLLCSLHLVAVPTWWALRLGLRAAWWLTRASYTRLWLLPELVGLAAAGFHWRWPVFTTGVQICLGAGVVRWLRGRLAR
jgi:hypothetical protein